MTVLACLCRPHRMTPSHTSLAPLSASDNVIHSRYRAGADDCVLRKSTLSWMSSNWWMPSLTFFSTCSISCCSFLAAPIFAAARARLDCLHVDTARAVYKLAPHTSLRHESVVLSSDFAHWRAHLKVQVCNVREAEVGNVARTRNHLVARFTSRLHKMLLVLSREHTSNPLSCGDAVKTASQHTVP